MRAFVILTGLFFSTLPFATKGQEASHTVVVKNLDKKKGELYIGWYNSPQTYMDVRKAVFKKVVAVSGKEEIGVTFDKVAAGKYAIAVFFDSNGNGKLDKNLLGIPREDYGFSNNIFPLTRSATFLESSFTVNSRPETIIIGIK